MARRYFKIKIDGESEQVVVSPETVAAGDLASLLQALEIAILDTANSRGATIATQAPFCIVGITEGSDELKCALDEDLVRDVGTINEAILNRSFDLIPESAQLRLHEVWKLAKRRRWAVFIAPENSLGIVDSVINPSEEIPASPEIRGNTTIYGRCIRVGGEDKPTAQIRLASGKIVTARMKRELAAKLAHELYSDIGLDGEAVWNTRSYEIVSFDAERMSAYRDTDPVSAFRILYEASGDVWNDVDADTYVRTLRDGA